MLTRRNRFHGYHSLDNAYRRGTTVRGQLMALRYAKNPKRDDYRVAVVVSKKVEKSAVGRNRIRRRIYEAVRLQAGRIRGGYDLVFTVYSADAATLPADHLQKTVGKLLAALN
jgi:ribonuclease P protein component